MKALEVVHMSFAKIYRYKGVTFDWHEYLGPIVINRHTEKERDYRNISLRNWAMIGKFYKLSDEQKEEHRIF